MAAEPLCLPAQVTMDDASAALREVQAALGRGDGPLRIDASALDELDTAAVALLLHARRLAGARGFELIGAPAKLTDLARLYGVDSLLGGSSSEAAGAA